ncbi:MAG: hypothetical protein UX08_C0027G0006 [Candidatus Collierbacteria bacterium GW2011_GWB1_45_35]|uniref:Uncharacterized protein n=1 Tax=Candidatus Collierbacteria bacterium GW2011_GWB2_45_17 TaxID=1618388 RepID=A0A837INX4_9BACT|nr:MAG: hypothetical protein UX01_C0016G0006 [Candidatus Collierbacteria bacterium GW2011_GWB2_45_17]KKU04410.1 MAG: hypothetical protein UX08_C0027G0006 [Candidatus Collierbacteria bacterium GW2011_GWB1_45_35]HBC45371.1 hypothetical protein [Candidatus Collierbacteria bacterium]
MNLFVKSRGINWTPTDLAYKSGGSNLDLGNHPISHDSYFAIQAITKTMTDRRVQFSTQDKELMSALCGVDGLPIKAPTLVIDPTKITRNKHNIPSRDGIPTKPWFVSGGKFLLVATICIYGAATPNESLGVYDITLYYCPHTFNPTINYLNLHDDKGKRIQNSGHGSAGVVRQEYYIKVKEIQRKDLLNHDSDWFRESFTTAAKTIPESIHALASIG